LKFELVVNELDKFIIFGAWDLYDDGQQVGKVYVLNLPRRGR